MKKELLLPTFEYIEEAGAAERARVESDGAFDAWWDLYPRKDAKQAARVEWRRLRPGPALVGELMAALRWQVRQWTDVQFVPHGRTYLHQRRWEDEQVEARPRGVAPWSEPWICRHVDQCAHRAMCDHKKRLPQKYPERVAS